MTAASWRFRSVCEKDLDKVLKELYTKISISMHDSWLGRTRGAPARQLSRDRNLELV